MRDGRQTSRYGRALVVWATRADDAKPNWVNVRDKVFVSVGKTQPRKYDKCLFRLLTGPLTVRVGSRPPS